MTQFDQLVDVYLTEASDSLHQWFKRGGTDPKTGKKFKGINSIFNERFCFVFKT